MIPPLRWSRPKSVTGLTPHNRAIGPSRVRRAPLDWAFCPVPVTSKSARILGRYDTLKSVDQTYKPFRPSLFAIFRLRADKIRPPTTLAGKSGEEEADLWESSSLSSPHNLGLVCAIVVVVCCVCLVVGGGSAQKQ